MAELVYAPVVRVALLAFKAFGFSLDIAGDEQVPRTGGFVLASNHVSHVDFVFAGLAAHKSRRYVRFMAKDVVFHHRVAGPLMRGMKHIPVDREAGAASFKAAVEALQQGEGVGVFPEATMSRSFELKEFKTGAVRMARAAHVPIVPVALWGTQRLAAYDKRATLRQRGVPVVIRVGPPLTPAGDPEQATLELRTVMQALVEDARAAYPEPGTGQWWYPVALGGTAPTLEEAAVLEAEAKARKAAKQQARLAKEAARAVR
jgi:1-acyl-sn-glycerol-3-phosphate acyltransferase